MWNRWDENGNEARWTWELDQGENGNEARWTWEPDQGENGNEARWTWEPDEGEMGIRNKLFLNLSSVIADLYNTPCSFSCALVTTNNQVYRVSVVEEDIGHWRCLLRCFWSIVASSGIARLDLSPAFLGLLSSSVAPAGVPSYHWSCSPGLHLCTRGGE